MADESDKPSGTEAGAPTPAAPATPPAAPAPAPAKAAPAAAKPAAAHPPTVAPPSGPTDPPPPADMAAPAYVAGLEAAVPGAVAQLSFYLGDWTIIVPVAHILAAATHLRDAADARFDFCSDVT